MNEPSTVTYSIGEVLKRIEDKIDDNQKELKQEMKEFKQEMKEFKQEMKEFNQKLDKQSEQITTIKATLQAQQPFKKSLT